MAIGNTNLTRPEYTAKTNQWIKDNPKKWAEIRATNKHPFTELQKIMEGLYGRPIWRDRRGRNKITGTLPTDDDPGIFFRAKGQKGSNKVSYQSDATRSATRGQPTGNSSGTRTYLEHAASKPGTDFVDANRAMAEARATGPGMDGGHRTPLDRKVRGQEFKVQSGRGTVQQMNQNFDKAGIPYGHTRENIEPQTAQANRFDQRSDYSRLDRHLDNLAKAPSFLDRIRMNNFRRVSGNLMFLLPDIVEIADSKTNGAVTNSIKNVIDTAVNGSTDLVKKGLNGWSDILGLARSKQLESVNYGQY